MAVSTVLVLMLVYVGGLWGNNNEAKANVAYFYPANCLGGWKNVDKISGQPEIKSSKDGNYNDSNSGSIFNSNAQLFCGSFNGEIPFAVENQKVTLNFSWYIEDGDPSNDFFVEDKNDEDIYFDKEAEVIMDNNAPGVISDSQEDQIIDEVKTDESKNEPIKVKKEEIKMETEEPRTEAEIVPETKTEEPAPEESSNPEPVSFNFFSIAHAEELVTEEVTTPELVTEVEEVPVELVEKEEININEEAARSATEVITSASSTEIEKEYLVTEEAGEEKSESESDVVTESGVESNIADGAYFEVLYTLDGQDWHSLGYVSRIANDVQIEMPIGLFSSVENLNKVQIALHTVDRFDSVPKIYLDSLWLEIVYDYSDEAGPIPPGLKSGDVIFSEVKYEDYSAVVVLRNVELITLSNVLSVATTTASSGEVIVEETVSTSSSAINYTEDDVATTTASSTGVQTEKTLTQIVATSTLSEIINSTGVTVELWLFSSSTNSWLRVADDSIISRNPQVKFESGSIFWVDKNNASVWRYNIMSGGYDALSLSIGESSSLQFRNEAGGLRELEFSLATSTLLMQDTKEVEIVSP